jgi:hypothetical protein
MLPRLIYEQQCFTRAWCHHIQLSPNHSCYITLRMEAASSSEAFVHICQSIQCHFTRWELPNFLLWSCLHTNQLSCYFCNLVHLPNKLFLMVCCYKTQLLFYLQKFTLKLFTELSWLVQILGPGQTNPRINERWKNEVVRAYFYDPIYLLVLLLLLLLLLFYICEEPIA